MFELSEAELQVLEELWLLIQMECTTQKMPLDDFGSKMSSTMPYQFADPLTEGRNASPGP